MMKFHPLLKPTIWGGDKIVKLKHLDSDQHQIGESWEISGIPDCETIVSEGIHAGKSLNEVVSLMRDRLLGRDNYQRFGDEFPLLIKFIDAHDDLSIQVHPDDATALRQGKRHGKTEMWYALPSSPDAQLYNGLKKHITPEEFRKKVDEDTVCDALARHKVSEGDVFFIPGGRIHSICKGCFVVEIQQTSDITYRIYDYKRRDKNGNYRPLHTQEAMEAIDYHVLPDYRTHYTLRKNEGVQLMSCPYFTTSVYDIDEPMTIDYSELDSFVILIGVKGEGAVIDDQGRSALLRAGDTILLPATTNEIHVTGTLRFLETYV